MTEKYGDRSCCGFIANDMMDYKGFPKEWSNIVREGRDGYLRFDLYNDNTLALVCFTVCLE